MRPFWSFLELSQARNLSRFKVHFPAVIGPLFLFSLNLADISGVEMRDEPQRTRLRGKLMSILL